MYCNCDDTWNSYNTCMGHRVTRGSGKSVFIRTDPNLPILYLQGGRRASPRRTPTNKHQSVWTIKSWLSVFNRTLIRYFRVILEKECDLYEVRLRINSVSKSLGYFDFFFCRSSCPLIHRNIVFLDHATFQTGIFELLTFSYQMNTPWLLLNALARPYGPKRPKKRPQGL